MTPLERYRLDLERDDFLRDTAQEGAVERLEKIYQQLANPPEIPKKSKKGLLKRLAGRRAATAERPAVKGLYLWGGVGRGKTYLVDTFYECLPLQHKQRIHFHRFMYRVHAELKTLKNQQNPLRIIGQKFAQEAQVLCFDEFFVSDITDAMLLAGLLETLFDNGVILIATSNIPPHKLYWDGLQRARFLPAIELMESNLDVIHLDGGVDYRLRQLEKAEIYHSPLDAAANATLLDTFEHVAPEPGHSGVDLEIEGRLIPTRRHADGVVWFDFAAICDGPRSTADYIEVARCYHTVVVSDLPVLDWEAENQARRFVNLVDEFYDRNVKLIMSGAAPLDEIYQGTKLQFEFKRTLSRLKEMQSHEYLASEHLP